MNVTVTGLFTLADYHSSMSALQSLMEALVLVNKGVLRNRALKVPPLYKSGVIYAREPNPGKECWSDAYTTWRRGNGDCDDLAGWLAAELQLSGVDATPVLQVQSFKPARLHVVVKTPWGIEDPSAKLGMTTVVSR